jgi:hypothetical protein
MSSWHSRSRTGCVVPQIASLVAVSISVVIGTAVASAQARAGGRSSPPSSTPGATAPAPGRAAVAAAPPKIDATLLQLMRGILFPSSNVIFAAQDDLSKYAPARDPSMSPNPLSSTYGGWEAVENAALALAESANLIVLPGRMCSNGKPVPVRRADWMKYAQGLRTAGLAAYKAAQSRNQDAMVEVSGTVADACSACHDVYREKSGGPKDRCVP